MGDGVGLELNRGDIVVAFVSSEKPRFAELWNLAANRTAEIVLVEVGIRVFALECSGSEIGFSVEVVEGPGGQRGVFVVVEHRAVILGAATLCVYANVGDAGIFGAEIGREDVYFAHRFERRLALRRFAEDAAVRALAVERETGAVTLSAEKLEFTVGGTLRDVGIEIEERVDVAAVTWKFGDGGAADRFGDRLVFGVDRDGLRGNGNALLARRDFELAVSADDVAASDDHILDFELRHA